MILPVMNAASAAKREGHGTSPPSWPDSSTGRALNFSGLYLVPQKCLHIDLDLHSFKFHFQPCDETLILLIC